MLKFLTFTITLIAKCSAQTVEPGSSCPDMNFFYCDNLPYKARAPECNACVLNKDVGNNPSTDFCYLKTLNRSCVDSAASRSEKFNKADGTQAILFTINMRDLRGQAASLQFKDSGGKVQFGIKVFRKIPAAPTTTPGVTTSPESTSGASNSTGITSATSTPTTEIYDPSPNTDLVKITLTNGEDLKVSYSIPFFSLPTDNDRAEFRIALVTIPSGKRAFSVTIGNNLRLLSAPSEGKNGIEFSNEGLACAVNLTENGSNASSTTPSAGPAPTVAPETVASTSPAPSNEASPATVPGVSPATPGGNKNKTWDDEPCFSSIFSIFRVADLMYSDVPKGLTVHGSFCRTNCTPGVDQTYYFCSTSWWLSKEGKLMDWDLCGTQNMTAHGYKCTTECKQNRGTYFCQVDKGTSSIFGFPATTLCGGIEDCSDVKDYCTPARPMVKP